MPFTPAQEAAITARNRELLVSAAAGSGKTRVLIERIYSLLQADGLSVDRLLVVTFTHAAAAEMRERLQARLTETAVDDRRMRRQAELLETAQICTLHSFCQQLVRAYFQAVDIDPQAMLGDETVTANLRAQAQAEAMEALYEAAAAGEPPAQALTAKFTDGQIDAMLTALYTFLMALPDPFGWLAGYANRTYTVEDLAKGAMADTLLADCRLLADGMAALAAQSEMLLENPLFPQAYHATVRADLRAVTGVRTAIGQGLLEAGQAARQLGLEKLPTVRGLEGQEAALRDQYKQNRDDIKKLATALAAFVPDDPLYAIARLNAMQPALRALAWTAQSMDERYAALKRDRALLDFHDLERMALRILQNAEIRVEVSGRYDGVFVDEYQDISAVQESILNALKRDVSRETSGPPQRYFYVGDVKQSIYRFRQADPTLFLQKAHAFAPDAQAVQRRITLNANFRSSPAVLAAVNRVFERVMRADVTEIDYDADARLIPGMPRPQGPPMRLDLFTQPVKAAQRARLQAYAIGCAIRDRVGEPVTDAQGQPAGTLHYKDFAILAPKMKALSAVLERTLTEMGIPVYCEDRGAAMESEEIAQALNHLRLMDNLADDLALLAVLRSPAMKFDERDLAEIRLRAPQGSYLEAVRQTAQGQDPLARRSAQALDTLARERFLLMHTPLDTYLWGWLTRAGLYAFYGCQPNGKLRQANLRMLCEKAGEHVQKRGGGLPEFLRSVEAQTGVRDTSAPTVLSPWEDVVRVMTIHKSKGLEFPVVFVMGLEERFGHRRASALAMHPRLGVALPYLNETARITGDTLLHSAIALRTQSEEKAERARLLYVAMTRARDSLTLLGCGTQLTPESAATGFAALQTAGGYAVFSANSMLDWVCQCANETDSVETESANTVIDRSLRKTEDSAAFSMVSTNNPQKTGVWRIVFHNDANEVKRALRYARGKNGLRELEKRRAKLNALAEDARRWAQRQGFAPKSNGEDALACTADAQVAPAGYQPIHTKAGNAPADHEESDAVRVGVPTDAQARVAKAQPGVKPPSAAPVAGHPASGGPHGRGQTSPYPDGESREYTASAPWDGSDAPKSAFPADQNSPGWEDPIAPQLRFRHHPFKVGATALARASQPDLEETEVSLSSPEEDAASVESPEQKRLPLPLTRPKRMADLPEQPAFLCPPAEQTGLRKGIATHRALSLLAYAPLAAAVVSPVELRAEIRRQLQWFAQHRQLLPEDVALIDAETVARFLESATGRAALGAPTVRREWSFNLRLPERGGVIVQGVIDLCYQSGGMWSLVDYKTDRVATADALWTLYGGQMALYRRALNEATDTPVRDATLFSLSLGVGVTRTEA